VTRRAQPGAGFANPALSVTADELADLEQLAERAAASLGGETTVLLRTRLRASRQR
jgi:hypothetical protein